MAEALEIYRWFRPLLDVDVSTKLVQNIKLVEALVINSNDRCRPPRLPLVGAERERIVKIVEKALANQPKLPALSETPSAAAAARPMAEKSLNARMFSSCCLPRPAGPAGRRSGESPLCLAGVKPY